MYSWCSDKNLENSLLTASGTALVRFGEFGTNSFPPYSCRVFFSCRTMPFGNLSPSKFSKLLTVFILSPMPLADMITYIVAKYYHRGKNSVSSKEKSQSDMGNNPLLVLSLTIKTLKFKT